MKLRPLGCRLAVSLAGVAFLSAGAHAATPAPSGSEDGLMAGFRRPPPAARPDTFYFWMNGNVTADGITRDLEAMKAAGLGGALIYDGSTDVPKGPVDYLSPKWRALMAHAIREGDRLGLKIGMHNAPGWSSSGGPWITPARAMQQMVWSETTVRGGRTVHATLPQPYTKQGFYRDAAVVAFPALPGERTPFSERVARVTSGGHAVEDAFALTDQDMATSVAASPERPLELELKSPMEARSLLLRAAPGNPAFTAEIDASADGVSWRKVGSVAVDAPRAIEMPGMLDFAPVDARFLRIRPSVEVKIAEVSFSGADRIRDWNYKAEDAYRWPRAQDDRPAPVAPDQAIDPAKVIDVTRFVDPAGRLTWRAPPGVWTVLRIGHTPTGQRNVSASASGSGLEVDKFDRAAVDYQFDHTVAQVAATAGPLLAKSFTMVEIDSYEAQLQNWTERLPQDFQARNGYALTAWLPTLTGRIVGDADRSERFLYDYRATLAGLMADNYYGEMAKLAKARGLGFYIEGYGPGPFDDFQVSGRAPVPMTEFWARTPWTDNRTVKMVASAAHVYGKPIIAAESFTAEAETGRWESYPYALKTLGDYMFAQGLNKIFFHRYAHQPHPSAFPGMTMGPWGIDLERTNTWLAKSRPFMRYLARDQFMLRQGRPVGDVLVFTGEQHPLDAEFNRPTASPYVNPLLAEYIEPSVPPGYTYDLINAEALLTRVRVQDGRIVLPDGLTYRMLVLPKGLHSMTPQVAHKLRELVDQGLVLMGDKPDYSLTLRDFPRADEAFHRDIDAIWGKGGATAVAGRAVGRGRVFTGAQMKPVLDAIGAKPDLEYTAGRPDAQLAWTHRKLARGADLYFVANRQRRADDFVISFRDAEGRIPEIWNPQTGKISDAAVHAPDGGRERVWLHLGPAESVFVVFREPGAAGERWIARNGERFASLDGASAASPDPAKISGTFTVSVWANPDIDLRLLPTESTTGRLNETGKNYVIPSREGDLLYGKGAASMGLAVGRNGAYVVERTTTSSPAVLVSHTPVAGWTHFAVVYDHGRPSLYINGKLDQTGLRSGLSIHPGVGEPQAPLGVTYYFEGDQTAPQVFDRALSASEIAAIAAKGLPAPALAAEPASVQQDAAGGLDLRLWRSGRYTTSDGKALTVSVPRPQTVAGPWRVSFPPGLGAPASIELPHLESLSHNSNPGVRYFSGTATYARDLDVPAGALGTGRRVYLDLGRVDVLADVRVNGRPVGSVWMPPYRVDITRAVHPGANRVEVSVTDLLPNRLIGDENLPPENTYVPSTWSVGEQYDPKTGRSTTIYAGKIVKLPDWYVQGRPKPPGGRITFSTWSFYRQGDPLLDSGLLGPVRLVFALDKKLP